VTTAEITRDFTFEAAHYLPNVAEGHKCGRMHGHSYRLTVAVAGDIDRRTGWVVDFAEIDAAVKPFVALLDHQTLNHVGGLDNPTSENIAVWFLEWLTSTAPSLGVVWVEISETSKSRCRIHRLDLS